MTQGQVISLERLLEGVDVLHLEGDGQVGVRGIRHDSRQVQAGDLFVAMTGTKVDGHRYLAEVARQKAVAAVVARPPAGLVLPAWVQVADTRQALARLSANFHGHPSLDMALVGITGTNGKTTLTYLLESVFKAAGHSPGVIGTVEVRYAGRREVAVHTTPESDDLQSILARMREAGCSHVLMETSSHALELQRSLACHVQVGVFTNLSRDHLDFHGDLERYAQAKGLLFSRELTMSQAQDKWAVFNADDPASERMVAGWQGNRLRFGRSAPAEVRPLGPVYMGLDGLRAEIACGAEGIQLNSALIGSHNLENLLAAVAVAHARGVVPRHIESGLHACRKVPGRLERVVSDQGTGPAVFVDYSHTDQALMNVLAALRPLTPGRLIVVFGCGGDRDQGKRPLMGGAVAAEADLALVTSDNPRSEDPDEIIDQILPGLTSAGWHQKDAGHLLDDSHKVFIVQPDRRLAIREAVALARAGDVVLVAGKGHETTQTIGEEKHEFDDRLEAAAALREVAK